MDGILFEDGCSSPTHRETAPVVPAQMDINEESEQPSTPAIDNSSEPMDVETDNSAMTRHETIYTTELTATGERGSQRFAHGVVRGETLRSLPHGMQSRAEMLADRMVFQLPSFRRVQHSHPSIVAPEVFERSIVAVADRSLATAPRPPSSSSATSTDLMLRTTVRQDDDDQADLVRRYPKRPRLSIEQAHLAFDAPQVYDEELATSDAVK